MTSMDDYYTARLNGKVPANFLANTSTSLDPVKNATTDILNKIGLINIIRAPSIDNPYARYIATEDRKSTRLNSSHVSISYAVFCLKKKNNNKLKTIKTNKA